MKAFLGIFAYFSLFVTPAFAISKDDIKSVPTPEGSIELGSNTMVWLLTNVQEILLYTVLPVVVVGAFLWVAYLLFTAEGDEWKMKQAWTVVAYSSIAIIFVLLSYVIISLISTLNF